MDDSAKRALARLRDPSSGSLVELARLMVAETTSTPLRELASPRFVAGQLAAALEAGTHTDGLRTWIEGMIDRERGRWLGDESPVGKAIPEEALPPLRGVLGRAYVPDEDLVYRMINQPAIRNLVHAVLSDTVTRFRNRLSDVEAMLGLSRRGAKVGSLFGNVGRNLGGMAQNLVGAVKEEVDHALEGRIQEFVQGATREAVRSIAAYVADETHGEAFAQMRLGVLDVLMETSVACLAGEADKMGPEAIVDVVVVAVRAAVDQEDFLDRLTTQVAAALDDAGDGTFGAWLAEVGLEDVWTEATSELMSERLQAVVATEGFSVWWAGLHEATDGGD